jgi:DNA-binding NtrC family response regulator
MDKKLEIKEAAETDAFKYPIVGKSKAVEYLREEIVRLSQVRDDTLVVGEAGVGKGAVAKNIAGENGPFLSINLSVMDDKELEAALFGFDRGAEGLPSTSKKGLFERQTVERFSSRRLRRQASETN